MALSKEHSPTNKNRNLPQHYEKLPKGGRNEY